MREIFQPTDCLSKEELEFYQKGEVSEDLRFKIENHLIDCPLCAEAIVGYQDLEAPFDGALDEIYNRIDERVLVEKKKSSFQKFPWNKIAAGFLLLISVGAAFFFYQHNQATADYQAYFNNEDPLSGTRAIEESSLPVDMTAGLNLFKDNNFQGSYSFFEDYLKINPESVEAAYYGGVSALKIKETGIAFDLISTVRINSDKLYEEATWILAGIHLQRKEPEMAKALLQELTGKENSFYKEDAEALLKELN